MEKNNLALVDKEQRVYQLKISNKDLIHEGEVLKIRDITIRFNINCI
jgi:hypothetical protein